MYILVMDTDRRNVFGLYNTLNKAVKVRKAFLEKTNYKNNIVIEEHKINSNIFED